nr:MAG TPA: hypothetical protein [Caudoviricetes sp.]
MQRNGITNPIQSKQDSVQKMCAVLFVSCYV